MSRLLAISALTAPLGSATVEFPRDIRPIPNAHCTACHGGVKEGAGWGAHWSFVPPVDHPLPKVEQKERPIHPLDHFILA